MGQPLRIEKSDRVSLVTTRTRKSELWFVANERFEEEVLAYVAKLISKYGVLLFALVFQGNHIHLVAQFPNRNRASFMRDLKSAIQRALKRYQSDFGGAQLWARRYSEEWLPRGADILDRLFYCALQPIAAGLTRTIEQYPGYNSFHDAIRGTEREYRLFDATAYYRAKRRDRSARQEDFFRTYVLKYTRPMEFNTLSNEAYTEKMLRELALRTEQVMAKRRDEGKKGFLGRSRILATPPGSIPLSTKTSRRDSKRPLVLTSCPATYAECIEITFSIRRQHAEASLAYRSGMDGVSFPDGTYPPPGVLKVA